MKINLPYLFHGLVSGYVMKLMAYDKLVCVYAVFSILMMLYMDNRKDDKAK